MTIKHAGLDALLSTLTAKKQEILTKAAAARGTTTHPADKVDNSTGTASTGARAAENTSDSKAQNSLNPDTAGDTKGPGPVAGSQGIDAKDATQAPADKPKTTGVSDMANQDTAHPTKSASVLLQERIKAAAAGCGGKDATPPVAVVAEAKKEGETVATEAKEKKVEDGTKAAPETKKVDQEGHTDEKVKAASEKDAAEKFAVYCQDLIEKHPEDFQAGVKFASEVLQAIAGQKKTAAAQIPQGLIDTLNGIYMGSKAAGATEEEAQTLVKQAAAEAGVDPAMLAGAAPEAAPEAAAEGDPAAAAAGGAPGGDELDQLAQELEAAGVTPEQLAQALQDTEQAGGDVPQQDEGQMQALQEALKAEGMSPEELAAAVGQEGAGAPVAAPGAAAGGADTGAQDAAGAAAAKAASDKHAALVEELRAQIRNIKAAKASGKK